MKLGIVTWAWELLLLRAFMPTLSQVCKCSRLHPRRALTLDGEAGVHEGARVVLAVVKGLRQAGCCGLPWGAAAERLHKGVPRHKRPWPVLCNPVLLLVLG